MLNRDSCSCLCPKFAHVANGPSLAVPEGMSFDRQDRLPSGPEWHNHRGPYSSVVVRRPASVPLDEEIVSKAALQGSVVAISKKLGTLRYREWSDEKHR